MDYYRDSYGRDDRRSKRDDYGSDYRRRRSASPRRDYEDSKRFKFANQRDQDYLMDFREFSNTTRDRNRNAPLDMDELDRRYEVYKMNFIKSQHEKFFKAHNQDEWFREKFHPVESTIFKQQISKRKMECRIVFDHELQLGKYDGVCFDEVTGKDSEDVYPELEPDTKANTLLLRNIPEGIKRADLLEQYGKIDGFKYLELSEPRPEKRMSRLGWIIFEPEFDLTGILSQVENIRIGEITISAVVPRKFPTNARFQPPYADRPERIHVDMESAKELAKFLDNSLNYGSDVGASLIESRFNEVIINSLAEPESKTSNENSESNEDSAKPLPSPNLIAGKKLLDLYILYLNRVHFYDYYTGVESTSPEDHMRRGGLPIRRKYLEPNSAKESSWEKKLDERIYLMKNEPDEIQRQALGYKDVDLQVNLTTSLYIRKEAESKFRCTECQKLFRGDDFVRKHIKTKHTNLIAHIEEEVSLYNSYCREASKIEIKPSQPAKRQERERDYRSGSERRSMGRHSEGGRDGRFAEGRRDSRPLRSYHDLDAPAGGDIQLSYD